MCTFLLFLSTFISLYLCYHFYAHYRAAEAALFKTLENRFSDGRLNIKDMTILYWCVNEEDKQKGKYLNSDEFNQAEIWKLTFLKGTIIYGILAVLSLTGAFASLYKHDEIPSLYCTGMFLPFHWYIVLMVSMVTSEILNFGSCEYKAISDTTPDF